MNVLPVHTICSIEYCGEFAFCVPIQNGIFLFVCSIEYSGEFDLLFACRFKMGYFCLFVQLNIVAKLLFACRFKMGYIDFNLAIAPHTVQLNECVCDPHRKAYVNRSGTIVDTQ